MSSKHETDGHMPTDENRLLAQALAAAGADTSMIAQALGICEGTVTRYYGADIECALPAMRARIGAALLLAALDGNGRCLDLAASKWLKPLDAPNEITVVPVEPGDLDL